MSKTIKTNIYIDEDVATVSAARARANKAERMLDSYKAEILSMIMCTPKDVTPDGEYPIEYLTNRFEEIWNGVYDEVVTEYAHTMAADDAEYNEDSLVSKQWREEVDHLNQLSNEWKEQCEWFKSHNLNDCNFNHIKIYDYCKDHEMMDIEPFTEKSVDELIKKINDEEREIMQKALDSLGCEND